MKAWLAYAATALVVTVAGIWIGQVVAGPDAVGAIRFAGILALLVQLAGFAVLVWVRARGELFLLGWGAGLMMRLAAVVLVAIWLSRDPVYPIRPALVGVVVFLFVLLLLEPLFLRRGLQTK